MNLKKNLKKRTTTTVLGFQQRPTEKSILNVEKFLGWKGNKKEIFEGD